jgi:hypothetical protein
MKRITTGLLLLLLAVLLAGGLATSAAAAYSLVNVAKGDGKLTVTYTAEQPCIVAAGVYAANGRLLDGDTVEGPAGTEKKAGLSLDLSAPGAASVKVFLLEKGTLRPLCAVSVCACHHHLAEEHHRQFGRNGRVPRRRFRHGSSISVAVPLSRQRHLV